MSDKLYEVAPEWKKRAFIDHPFSPFVNITVEQMKELSKVGITFNFTFDELSPMLGVDPGKMYEAIRKVGNSEEVVRRFLGR